MKKFHHLIAKAKAKAKGETKGETKERNPHPASDYSPLVKNDPLPITQLPKEMSKTSPVPSSETKTPSQRKATPIVTKSSPRNIISTLGTDPLFYTISFCSPTDANSFIKINTTTQSILKNNTFYKIVLETNRPYLIHFIQKPSLHIYQRLLRAQFLCDKPIIPEDHAFDFRIKYSIRKYSIPTAGSACSRCTTHIIAGNTHCGICNCRIDLDQFNYKILGSGVSPINVGGFFDSDLTKYGAINESWSLDFPVVHVTIVHASIYDAVTGKSFGRYVSRINRCLDYISPRPKYRCDSQSVEFTTPHESRPSTYIEDSVSLFLPLDITMNITDIVETTDSTYSTHSHLVVCVQHTTNHENLILQIADPLHFLNYFSRASRLDFSNSTNSITDILWLNLPQEDQVDPGQQDSNSRIKLDKLLETMTFVIEIKSAKRTHSQAVKITYDDYMEGLKMSFPFNIEQDDQNTWPNQYTIYGIKDGNRMFRFISENLSAECCMASLDCIDGFEMEGDISYMGVRATSTHLGNISNEIFSSLVSNPMYDSIVHLSGFLMMDWRGMTGRKEWHPTVMKELRTKRETMWCLNVSGGCEGVAGDDAMVTVLHACLSIISNDTNSVPI